MAASEKRGTSQPVVIRQIEVADAEQVSELCAQLGYDRSPDQICEWTEAFFGSTTQVAFVATVAGLDEQIVGWIEVSVQHHLQSPPAGLIGGLVVRDGVRGGGIGKQLCERAEAWALERGLRIMRVTSRSTREAAHRFYVRDGYQQTKISAVFEKKLQ